MEQGLEDWISSCLPHPRLISSLWYPHSGLLHKALPMLCTLWYLLQAVDGEVGG